ncbi:hypothetical protein M8C21_019362 [Ambrosia artemisiifolia]|uniref:Ornithine aminotransferase n=1 Tax=Ambrosia artemisiifolia TaxID=4212 RepID=A0AAD5CFP7_AMBAR|nr:hypothetical protein M8C21_019362 [Ambrosia artemisiifolia]
MASRVPLQLILNKIKNRSRGSVRCFGTVTEGITSPTASSRHLIGLEHDYSAHNYHPVPVVFSHGKGSAIWDPEGNKYLDFLAAYSAVNQGHCHPKIMKALIDQAQTLTLSSRAFYNDKFPVFAEYLTKLFGYDMVLPMNTGAEGVETALKLARKWGYEKKRIPKDQAIIVSCCGCFHGRTMGAISMSCDNDATRGFWPLLPGQLKVDFGDEAALKKVIIPPDGYLKAILGKALGGNPLASAVGIASLQVIQDEKLAERSAEMGEELRRLLAKTQQQFPEIVLEIRGKGLFNAVELISKSLFPATAYDLCIKLKERGILAKPTHNATIRLTPPLSISLDEIREGAKAFHDVLEHDLPKLVREKPKPASPKAQDTCDRCGRELYG